ncbi:ABC transporter substrate-binding protein [Spirosoma fluviale]|uniref:Amino acid/amide ABC transporter substrate-binding protein, HAAT family n=1 Tax=Spirosoma fluviale TaxID=1597977 RepID=A0A286FGR7_9BACT|nr:ABC transporter substrate-binding protein [Spirosoma fluviale]SOD81994.1 amino acid/amide ABC transporter substrate-binding protein, HAAT family [Spirosoma fluviale]
MNGRFLFLIKLLVVFSGVICSQVAQAQLPADAQKRYKAALELVRTGDYERAKSDLNVLIQQRGPLAPYATYHYAIAAFRQRKFLQSRDMLKQLMEQYPDWQKMDDANYLFAASGMELGQYEEALTALQSINDAELRSDVTKLEQNFIPRITDLTRLKALNQSFPADRIIGLALIDLIQRTATDKDDLELSDRLTNRFGVPAVTTTQPTATTSQGSSSRPVTPISPNGRNTRPKGYYNVAVMFPFRVDEFNSDKRSRANQYVYDLYNGIKLAKAKLQEEGISINLFAYDLDNDANKALELVNSPAFAQTDLIIGPLYLEPNRIALAYANQHNILLLNPIATSSELITDQPMSFLAQPSMNQQARKVADLVRSLNTARRAAIYFGATRKDSLLAAAYQAELKRQNYQVVDFRKLKGSAQQMSDAMQFSGNATATRSGTAISSPSGGASVGHVFFSSTNEDDGVRMLDALSRRRVSAPLISTASAFDLYKVPVSTFTRRELYLLYPDFMDKSRESVTAFQEEYLAKRNTIPSVYASEGYDMMLFFGRQLAKNGLQLRDRTALISDTDDYLLSGFDYTQSNDNQLVPIVKYEDGRFVKINE